MTRKITIVITNLEFNTETEHWRLHVKTLFENMAFLSLQQGLVKKEPKQNMSSSSEVNRGNFIGIELLSLRAKDVPVVKIETPVNNFGGGGSGYGAVQNEIISNFYSIIEDETTDLSKIEQFSLSISYLTSDRVKMERFLQSSVI